MSAATMSPEAAALIKLIDRAAAEGFTSSQLAHFLLAHDYAPQVEYSGTWLTPPVAVPCPSWCTDTPGHGYEVEDDDGHQGRFHSVTHATTDDEQGSSDAAHISAVSYWIDGKEVVGTPAISVVVGGNMSESSITDVAAARRLAAALLAAADQLEHLRSDSCSTCQHFDSCPRHPKTQENAQ